MKDLKKLKKLNVGCYHKVLPGYINSDVKKFHKGVDMTLDLTKYPYNFPDNRFDEVYCRCVLEHIDSKHTKFIVDEFWRITRPGGIIRLIVPYEERWMDSLDHRRGFSWAMFGAMGKDNLDYIGKARFKIKRLDPIPTVIGKLLVFKKLQKWVSLFIKNIVYEIDAQLEVVK